MKKIAISSRYSLNPIKLISFAELYNFDGIEYSIQSENKLDFNKEIKSMKILSKSGLEVRYHMPFKVVELSHKSDTFSKKSLEYFKFCFDQLECINARHVIIHLCLGYRYKLQQTDYNNAIHNLIDITQYGKQRGITVCLENLTFGLNCNPKSFLNFLKKSNCKATIDIGHIAATDIVLTNQITDLEYIEEISPYIESAHIYDIEKYNPKNKHFEHIAPKNMKDIENRVLKLKESPCNWYLIELGNKEEILRTQYFLKKLL